MTTNKDILVSWLRDAHAMEKAATDTLDRLEDSLERLPHLATQFRQHRDESRAQTLRIEDCLHNLGTDVSRIKDVASRTLAGAQLYATAMTADQLVKRFMAAYAFESFEIASYLALGAAARAMGERAVEQMCEEHLEQERAMARWLEQHMAEVTEDFLRP